MKIKNNISDQGIEIFMGNLLRFGVLFSSAFIIFGGIIYLTNHGNETPNYTKFSGEPQRFINLSAIFHSVISGSGRAIIQTGVLLLIATPVARVLFSIIGFILEKDKLYIVITVIVSAILLYSIIG